MASVEIRALHKNYGSFHAIKGVDVDVADGEFVVLVGPSGCGKSTLLRTIAGLEDITSGDIRIGGRVVNDLEPRERDIAMVFQTYALYPHMTVRENMGFNLALKKAPAEEIERKVREAADILGIGGLLDRKPRELSGGQRQRVAMGRAIVRHPQVFLFDEPLSNLDAKLRVQMRAEIRALHDRLGATSIYVTHDQVEAMTMADRIVVLDRGEIAQEGSPLELYERPANRFVAEFIGSPAINLFSGEISADRLVLPSDGGRIEVTLPAPVSEPRVDVGVRPEHFRPVETGGLPGEVRVVEHLGAETYVIVDVGVGQNVCWRSSGTPDISVGDRLRLGFDPSKIHLFSAATGARVGSIQ
ncbi:sn-glycerol-3-phosphate ABC transporter ATP-binding protein UgpC [Chelativorans sp. AA-79]|uniref:ABC transporter ATP-binding protein n=1 Tax=Chelativorans sp. AA-79 TaxID=3028735 RepID=UPI0023F92DAE|nr:sn-glycerol-3-phosphate ABC transporter ATP-binding protein UgpC [Chelativorans sp. AA-79]WEX08671.1 sn-glycerol-3-phosphate ABC transporter ATP-binding protein UgpC [Chelativorans sp. AA-79]